MPTSQQYIIYFISTVIKVKAQLPLSLLSCAHCLPTSLFASYLLYTTLSFVQRIFPTCHSLLIFYFPVSWQQSSYYSKATEKSEFQSCFQLYIPNRYRIFGDYVVQHAKARTHLKTGFKWHKLIIMNKGITRSWYTDTLKATLSWWFSPAQKGK